MPTIPSNTSEYWIRVMDRIGSALLFVMLLSFSPLLTWLSLCIAWEGNHIVKDLPTASGSRPTLSMHDPFVDLHIGRSGDPAFPEYIIQAWNVIIVPEEIPEFVHVAREYHEEIMLPRFYVRLFIARDVPMVLVKAVRGELRKAGVSKVKYMTWSPSNE